ncbi:mycofactocin-coupled SDR family oxidoreductase [Amycolatopsis acidicola]|uniref:Mycofactocin-coupled SDR family oxidoreductase n=1 Tax=Amycolatopsis acidicola TaxID=2596893 RepID=A0A5N0VMR3_9PSEU|nr:mycofactocin-coupled SDR family oxidoreductase [Amycolatopsis acidicola]KAA9166460.1 mycofactocin-coupled SDR family oxidoreductase [Amycolatopsis acidicola]
MGKFDGKVAFVTGGARGQGRSHAVNLAREGADVVVLDLCRQIDSVQYPMSSRADLQGTVALVEKEGRRALAVEADVRDHAAVEDAVRRGIAEFGHLDLVVANAGIMPTTGPGSLEIQAWADTLDVMLTGVFYTVRETTRAMLDAGTGGAVVITGSTSSFRGVAYDVDLLNPGQIGYGAAKHGVIAIMKNFARALGQYGVRVNLVAPAGVRTPMVVNDAFSSLRSASPPGWMANAMNVDLAEPQDISDAVLWLLSEESRYVTGTAVPVDAGQLLC